MKTYKIFLAVFFVIVITRVANGDGSGGNISPASQPPPPSPPLIDCNAPGIRGSVTDQSKSPLPTQTSPYTYMELYVLGSDPYYGTSDQVLIYVNSTNWWQDCRQGIVEEDGKFLFNTDTFGNPLPASNDYVLVVYEQIDSGYFTVRKIVKYNGKKDTRIKIVMKQSAVAISPPTAAFASDDTQSVLHVSFYLGNAGNKPTKLHPYLIAYLPGDIGTQPVPVEPVGSSDVTVQPNSARLVEFELLLRKMLVGLSVYGNVVVTEADDPLATRAEGFFQASTK